MVHFWPRLLSNLSPVRPFPSYKGPYAVGTIDVEIPTADLSAPCARPAGAVDTVAFRVFYPCEKPTTKESARPVRWIPHPQSPHIAAFARYLGVGHGLAELVSHIPSQLFWIKLPAYRNAKLKKSPTSNSRWPVTVFSHGLAGSRNGYSYVCGDLASNGMIVVALDHRDGSSPIQYVRATASSKAQIVHSIDVSRKPTEEALLERDRQLRIRLWEIGIAFEALMEIDKGDKVENLDDNTSWSRKERMEVLQQFESTLDIHRAGKVSWAGHSFGSATVVQLLKTVFYRKDRPDEPDPPIFKPYSRASIAQQITPQSPALLLDPWAMPLTSAAQHWLWELPLPSYAPGGPNGDNVLAVLSESFDNWQINLDTTRQLIARPESSQRTSDALHGSDHEKDQLPLELARLEAENSSAQGSTTDSANVPSQPVSADPLPIGGQDAASASASKTATSAAAQTHGPYMFYPVRSQHFNQSDFGLLFPWLAKKHSKADDAERILELNVRAMVEVVRKAGVEVAGKDDSEILGGTGSIQGWIPVPVTSPEPLKETGEASGERA